MADEDVRFWQRSPTDACGPAVLPICAGLEVGYVERIWKVDGRANQGERRGLRWSLAAGCPEVTSKGSHAELFT